MIVTVIVDASFCHLTKAAGYGVAIVSDLGRLTYGNRFRDHPESSTEAETLALANALWIVERKVDTKPGDRIVAQSDCKHALRVMGLTEKDGPWPAGVTQREKDAHALVHAMLVRKGLTLDLKHVKGHDYASDKPRSYVQQTCDDNAKHHMERMRQGLRKRERRRRSKLAKKGAT